MICKLFMYLYQNYIIYVIQQKAGSHIPSLDFYLFYMLPPSTFDLLLANLK